MTSTVTLKDLPEGCSDLDIRHAVAPYGTPTEIVMHYSTNQATLTMEQPKQAQLLLATRRIAVGKLGFLLVESHETPSSASQRGTASRAYTVRAVVENCQYPITPDVLTQVFVRIANPLKVECGSESPAKVVVGFVTFKDEESARRALEELNNKNIYPDCCLMKLTLEGPVVTPAVPAGQIPPRAIEAPRVPRHHTNAMHHHQHTGYGQHDGAVPPATIPLASGAYAVATPGAAAATVPYVTSTPPLVTTLVAPVAASSVSPGAQTVYVTATQPYGAPGYRGGVAGGGRGAFRGGAYGNGRSVLGVPGEAAAVFQQPMYHSSFPAHQHDAFQGALYHGQAQPVGYVQQDAMMQYGGMPGETAVILISGVPENVSLHSLWVLLEVYGNVNTLKRQYSNRTAVIAQFQNVQDARSVLFQLQDCPFYGSMLQLKHFAGYQERQTSKVEWNTGPPTDPATLAFSFAQFHHRTKPSAPFNPKQKNRPDRYLFVSNLNEEISDEETQYLFAQRGFCVTDYYRKSPVAAIVSFETVEEAVDALVQTHGVQVRGRYLSVAFSRFPPGPIPISSSTGSGGAMGEGEY